LAPVRDPPYRAAGGAAAAERLNRHNRGLGRRAGKQLSQLNPKPPAWPAPPRAPRVAPLYHQLYLHLRQSLTEDRLDPEQPLPSEPTLVRQFGVSRVTVRRTLDQLETEGLIRRVRGRGTFPAERADLPDAAAKTNISSLLENLLSFEQTTTAVNLEWGEVAPAGEAARALGREPCLRIVRVRRYEGRPISLTTIHVPRRFAALLDPGARPTSRSSASSTAGAYGGWAPSRSSRGRQGRGADRAGRAAGASDCGHPPRIRGVCGQRRAVRPGLLDASLRRGSA
jgi:DNA-binding GntR family transcriptional regulator